MRTREKNSSSVIAVSVQVRQLFSQLRARERKMRAHRSLAQSRHRGNLAMLELFDQMQPRDDALHLRQLVDGPADPPRDLARDRRKIGAVPARGRLSLRDLFVLHALAMLEHVEREIRGDAKDPRSERLVDAKASDALIRLHERLLRQLLGVIRAAHDAPRNREDSLRIKGHQDVERPGVPSLRALDELAFGLHTFLLAMLLQSGRAPLHPPPEACAAATSFGFLRSVSVTSIMPPRID